MTQKKKKKQQKIKLLLHIKSFWMCDRQSSKVADLLG